MKISVKHYRVLTLGLLAGTLLGSSAYAQTATLAAPTAPATATTPIPSKITSTATTDDDTTNVNEQEIHNFSAAYNSIKRYYVEPVKDDKIFENAIRGMLTGLDPHSDYLNPEEFKALRDNTAGKFAGLGVEIGVDHGLLKVISPLDDSPAYIAGIKAGDYIIKLDSAPVKGMTLREAMNRMRGQPGTAINLTVLRKGANDPLKINIVRQYVQLKSVKSQLLDNNFGYVRISQFQLPTAEDMQKNIKDMQGKAGGKLNGLILDLRNNPGGLLDSAVDVSDAFLDSNKMKNAKIVYTKGRMPQTMIQANATPGDVLNGSPMVVLINEGSASSSEIVAGALQDQNRAIILGTQSFGKGSVQTVLPIGADRGVKLTTAFYYTPNGRLIQAKGIAPDVTVEEKQIVEKPDPDPDYEIIHEADLLGHLDNNTATDKPVIKLSKQEEEMATKLKADYQVQQALNLLKGLAVKQVQ